MPVGPPPPPPAPPQPVQYTVPPPPAPAGRGGGRALLWIFGGCGLLLVLGIGACLVGGGLLAKFGLDVFEEQVRAALEDNPVVVEHLGRLQELDTNMSATAAADGNQVFVFDAVGTKASGRITAECVTVEVREEVRSGHLRLESGEEYDLFPDPGD